MSESQRRAPPGKFQVGEGNTTHDEFGFLEPAYDTLGEARAKAQAYTAERRDPDLQYFVYDENGFVP